MQVHEAHVDDARSLACGELLVEGRQVLIGTSEGALQVQRAQLPGGRPIDTNALVQKLSQFNGALLGTEDRHRTED